MKFNKLIPLLIVTGCMSSCSTYKSRPGRIENLVGTYKLVEYKMKHEEVTEGDNTYNKQSEIGAVAYFSIAEDGYGYYAYKDNSTAARVDSMFVSFYYSSKKPNLVEAIKMTDGLTSKYDDQRCPGCLDEPKMGFVARLFKKSLNYTINSGHRTGHQEIHTPYRHVEYKRVSKEASLAKVNEYMGTNVSFTKPYEMKAMTGYAVYRCYPKDGEMGNRGFYEYAVLDLDSYSNGEMTITYSLKQSPAKLTKKVSVSIEEKGKSVKFDGFGKTFHSTNDNQSILPNGYFRTLSSDFSDSVPLYDEYFDLYFGDATTLDEIIEQEKASLV